AQGNGLWLARIIGPLPRLSPKRSQNLPSKEASRLRPAFVAVKRTFLDRFARCEKVNIILRHHWFYKKFGYVNFIPGNQYLLANDWFPANGLGLALKLNFQDHSTHSQNWASMRKSDVLV
ncbi:hypothetical protein AVEN_44515-1, partial [Araneus ventricosus]